MRFPASATLRTGLNATAAHHALCLRVARNPWTRFRGLMLAAPLATEPRTQALFITRCPSVHGFFMRYAIDVMYLANAINAAASSQQGATHYTVTHTASLKPWRVSFGRSRVIAMPDGRHVLRSAHALELPAGSIERMRIAAGDELVIHP